VGSIGQDLPDEPAAVSVLDLLADRCQVGEDGLGVAQEIGVGEPRGEVADRSTDGRGGLSIVRALVRDELGGTIKLLGGDGLRVDVRFPA
jgi:two-component sensor histidine kinase